MHIYIVRHGQTAANKERRMQGWLDIPLNEYGRELAVLTGKGLAGVKFDAAFSSSLDRAKETAEIVLRESGNEGLAVQTDDRIKEIYAGDWEGRLLSEINPDDMGFFILDPAHIESTPNGETFDHLKERTQGFLKELIDENKYENVLVSTHGCALRAMLNMFYEDKNDFWHGKIPANCAVNIVEADGNEALLVKEDLTFY